MRYRETGIYAKNSQGSVLILVLVVLMVLTIFTASMAAVMRQGFHLSSRLNDRQVAYYGFVSALEKARAVMKSEDVGADPFSSPETKAKIFRNTKDFVFPLSQGGVVSVSYMNFLTGSGVGQTFYGLEDEERKLNVNYATFDEMTRLFQTAAGISQDACEGLANAIIDWRSPGDMEIVGFLGDDYYRGLTYPYESKGEPFEVLEEVLLVKGMNPDIFERIKPFITIYGEGVVNINTASPVVLIALGLTPAVANKIVSARKGQDRQEATEDDFIFLGPEDLHSDLGGFGSLRPDEIEEVMPLFAQQKLGIESSAFSVYGTVFINGRQQQQRLHCVFLKDDGRILRWRQN